MEIISENDASTTPTQSLSQSHSISRVLPLHGSPRKLRANIHRTQTGCRTCRARKVKCDEQKPVCSQCSKKQRVCEWPGPASKRAKVPRRPTSTACISCRQKKLKCSGGSQEACERCRDMGLVCTRSKEPVALGSSRSGLNGFVSSTSSMTSLGGTSSDTLNESRSAGQPSTEPPRLVELPNSRELDRLVDLYFRSVHQFGVYCFIHHPQFKRLLSEGKAPRELTLMMIASATRFGDKVSAESIARADAWADAALATLLPHIFQGFGVIQLMTLLLAQHYDLHRGNFTSAWLLGANCTRMMQMMSLQSFDRAYPAMRPTNPHLSPLLSSEALRRVAWCTFYADHMIDGGRYGWNTVDEKAYRLQLPCEQTNFLSNEIVVTEPLFPGSTNFLHEKDRNIPSAPLDMTAYLLRTAAARRRALYFAFRASHHEEPVDKMTAELCALETDMEAVISDLPKRFHFNRDSLFVHRERLTTFFMLHVLRHNLFIVLGRAALSIYQRDPANSDVVNQIRRKRISRALPIAGMISEGLKAGVIFDPDIGIQAYVALEILLFEPHRLFRIDASIDEKAPELVEAVTNLLAAIREIGSRSEVVKQLHIESVHRLLRFDYTHLLNKADFAAFHSEYQLVGQDPAEYDFRDFRWAKLERLRRGARSSVNIAQNESLLDYSLSGDTTVPALSPSPRLDAIDVNSSTVWPSASDPHSARPRDGTSSRAIPEGNATNQHPQQSWGFAGNRNADVGFPLDWPWLLEESSNPVHQTGDPVSFWSQLQHM